LSIRRADILLDVPALISKRPHTHQVRFAVLEFRFRRHKLERIKVRSIADHERIRGTDVTAVDCECFVTLVVAMMTSLNR